MRIFGLSLILYVPTLTFHFPPFPHRSVMKRFSLSLSPLVLVACLTFVLATNAVADDGWQSLFNGKSLDGWEVSSDKGKEDWTVKDGAIHGDGDKVGQGTGRDAPKYRSVHQNKFRFRNRVFLPLSEVF